VPEVVQYRIQSQFTNAQLHNSAILTFTITCGNFYNIFPLNTVNNLQYVSHLGEVSDGFIIPKFYTSQ